MAANNKQENAVHPADGEDVDTTIRKQQSLKRAIRNKSQRHHKTKNVATP